MASLSGGLADRLAEVRARITSAGGDLDRTTIVAVTKGVPESACAAAVDAGLVDLGENYAQGLVAKAGALAGGVRWHFLGVVQRNKVRRLAGHVHLWQGVDSEAAGRSIAGHAPGAQVLVEVNLSGAPQRGGCSWEEAPPLVDALAALGLHVNGVMGVGDPDDPRPGFRRLARLAGSLGLPMVSMGMSADLEIAVEEGSTMVRVGTALFGPRPVHGDLRR